MAGRHQPGFRLGSGAGCSGGQLPANYLYFHGLYKFMLLCALGNELAAPQCNGLLGITFLRKYATLWRQYT